MPPKLVILSGPTAVGKSAFAAQIARIFQTRIISADSRQCYRELNIGTAKPPAILLEEIPHYFINSHSIHHPVHASDFESLGLAYAREIFLHRAVGIVCGGTGLYIKALCDGLDQIPGVDPGLKEKVASQYRQLGLGWLQESVRSRDPEYYASSDIRNPRRLLRALEVCLSTGKPFSSFRTGKKAHRPFSMLRIAFKLPGETLRSRINRRVDAMISQGLVEECEGLRAYRGKPVLQTLGYQEIFTYLDGNSTLGEAVERIKSNTWQYARRQMTWLRGQKDWIWMDPGEEEKNLRVIREFAN
ncbi:MAG TPA: tRNA (adenosine(37)-N6)-dimethylallyltransferase MiaA [Chitinophagaceae bacterium]|nr:tRNA (adenosine(37)-N6)-dimethylallyltransferase MiaA [Chitinophagaceae bacterium]